MPATTDSHSPPSRLPPLTATQVTAEPSRLFPQTSQTLIHRIQQGAPADRQVSLAKFCTLYYPAIYGTARMRGMSIEDAEDITQEFFVEVVRDDLLSKYDLGHGSRLSSWLITCFKHLALNQHARTSTAKRGGTHEFVSFDTDFAERCHHTVAASHLTEASGHDLTLSLSFWRCAEMRLRGRYLGTPNESLVHDLLPLVLLKRWPEPPALSQHDIALKHSTRPARLKAFFNRTLKSQAERLFREEAQQANPGITSGEIDELWVILRLHAAAH